MTWASETITVTCTNGQALLCILAPWVFALLAWAAGRLGL